MSAIIVCGSGPSLLNVPFDEVGLPYAAVSTAIRFTPSPAYWILIDRLSRAHQRDPSNPAHRGPDAWTAARDRRLKKVGPADRGHFFEKGFENMTVVPRRADQSFLGDGPALSLKFNRSMLFAIEWLMKCAGFQTLIFAGCDLKMDPEHDLLGGLEATPKERRQRVIRSRDRAHGVELRWLAEFHEIALAKGFRWLNWTPGGPLATILPAFDGHRQLHQGLGGEVGIASGLHRPGD